MGIWFGWRGERERERVENKKKPKLTQQCCRLELGYNLIKRIQSLRGLVNLTELELNNNLLNRLEDIKLLGKVIGSQLKKLDLRNNPLCKANSYKTIVMKSMPALEWLDGVKISEKDRQMLIHDEVGLSVAHIRKFGFATSSSGCDGDRPWASRKAKGGGGGGEGENEGEKEGDDGEDPNIKWMNLIEELDVSQKNLQYIANMDNMINLRRLSVSDNEITVIEGLNNCVKLEEICLENNRISLIEGLECLQVRAKRVCERVCERSGEKSATNHYKYANH